MQNFEMATETTSLQTLSDQSCISQSNLHIDTEPSSLQIKKRGGEVGEDGRGCTWILLSVTWNEQFTEENNE